ncbi:MAG: diguanylate cyclase [Magnetococcus sp. XQGC-1]
MANTLFGGMYERLSRFFQTKFLRKSFFLILFLVILLPVHAMHVTYPSFRNILTQFTEEDAVQVANYMAVLLNIREEEAVSGHYVLPVSEELTSGMARVAEAFHLYKYRLFDASGRIIHSSAPKEIGKLNEHAYFHDIVAKGHPYSLTVQKDHKTLENEIFKLDVVETYVPIMRAGRFLGAFEIYFDITAHRKRMDWVVTQASAVLLSVAALFFLVIVTTRLHVLRRIGEFMQAMNEAARGDFHRRIPASGQDELTDMATGFNRMSEELHRLHRGFQNEQNKLTTIILSAREGIVVTDAPGNVVMINPAAERILEKTQEELTRQGFLAIVDDPAYVQTFLAQQGSGMPDSLVYKNRVLNFHAATIHNGQGQTIGSAALIRDVTAEKRLEEALRMMSYTDKLTGLYNRRRMEELLDQEYNRARRYNVPLSVLFFDVDHFKKFNDTYGHDMGDKVLEVIGQIAKAHFRTVDHGCRYGGEEFCIILPNTGAEGARMWADRFRQRLEETEISGLRVTCSIGVVTYPCAGCEGWESFLKLADNALYEAKRMGRNRVVPWTEGMTGKGV